MSTRTIERDIEIEAPVDIVWRTITEPELVRTWFSDAVELDARPGAVGTLTFRANSDNPRVVDITVVATERPHRFSFRWCYPRGDHATVDHSTLVTFTLTAAGDARRRSNRSPTAAATDGPHGDECVRARRGVASWGSRP
jgi:uncharacterized protein YndB with AHSA1/START domain